MAELLREGYEDRKWSAKLVCPSCGSLVRIYSYDIRATLGPSFTWSYTWPCPACSMRRGRSIWNAIDSISEAISAEILEAARNRFPL